MVNITSPKKAKKFFDAKMNFTTGPAELHEKMKNGKNINIIDVRHKEDFSAGHIPGSVNLTKGQWNTHQGLSKDRLNIIYCYSKVCHLAASAAREFAGDGYPVMELEGGFDQWRKYHLPIER